MPRRSIALATLLVCGCGATSERDVHALYAALQVEEARSAAAQNALLEGTTDDPEGSCVEACDAASVASELAGRIGERDATIRAEHVVRVCVACRGAR